MSKNKLTQEEFESILNEFATYLESLLEGENLKHSVDYEDGIAKIVITDKQNSNKAVVAVYNMFHVENLLENDLIQPELYPIQDAWFKYNYCYLSISEKDAYVDNYIKYWNKFIDFDTKELIKEAKQIEDKAERAERLRHYKKVLPSMRKGSLASHVRDMVEILTPVEEL